MIENDCNPTLCLNLAAALQTDQPSFRSDFKRNKQMKKTLTGFIKRIYISGVWRTQTARGRSYRESGLYCPLYLMTFGNLILVLAYKYPQIVAMYPRGVWHFDDDLPWFSNENRASQLADPEMHRSKKKVKAFSGSKKPGLIYGIAIFYNAIMVLYQVKSKFPIATIQRNIIF